MADKVFRAKSAFVAPDPTTGGRLHVTPGFTVAEGHWVLDGRESLFEDVIDVAARTANPTTSVRPVEQATAAPGEKRSTRRTAAGE